MKRDSARDATEVYAWKSVDHGSGGDPEPEIRIRTQPGDTFTASVFSDDTFSTGVHVHGPDGVWEFWLPGQLPRDSVVPSTIDADTASKQKAIRDAIDAEVKLHAGTGVRIGVPNAAGKRTIAVANRKEIADDAFRQPPLDQSKPWRVPAIEADAPVIVKLTYDDESSPPKYQGSFKFRERVSVEITYIRLDQTGEKDRGRFVITAKTAAGATNNFPVDTLSHLTIRIGANEDEAMNARLIRLLLVQDSSSGTSTLLLRTESHGKERPQILGRAEGLLGNPDVNEVYAKINFVVDKRELTPDPASDLTAATIKESSLGSVDIGGIASDDVSLFVVDRNTFDITAFTDNVEDKSKRVDGAKIKEQLGDHAGENAVGLTIADSKIFVLSDSGYVAVCEGGECIDKFVTVGAASGLGFDGELILVGANWNDEPKVRTYHPSGERDKGRPNPHNMGFVMSGISSDFRVGAVASDRKGVIYVADRTTGSVHAFVAGAHDDSKKDLETGLKGPHLRGLAVHNGKLYVAGADSAAAYHIPDDVHLFPEGYHFTVLDQADLQRAARGLMPIHNDALGEVRIASNSATSPAALTSFDPSFVLNLEGILLSQLELSFSTTKPSTVGFDHNAAATCHEAGMATVGSLKSQAAYAAGGDPVNGVAVAAAPIYEGSDQLGVLRLYLVRKANDELGCLFHYAPSGLPGVRTHQLTVTVKRLTLSYLYLPLP